MDRQRFAPPGQRGGQEPVQTRRRHGPGQQHPAGLPDRGRGGRVDADTGIQACNLHPEGAPRFGICGPQQSTFSQVRSTFHVTHASQSPTSEAQLNALSSGARLTARAPPARPCRDRRSGAAGNGLRPRPRSADSLGLGASPPRYRRRWPGLQKSPLGMSDFPRPAAGRLARAHGRVVGTNIAVAISRSRRNMV